VTSSEFTQVPPCYHRWPNQWWLEFVGVCLWEGDPLRHIIVCVCLSLLCSILYYYCILEFFHSIATIPKQVLLLCSNYACFTIEKNVIFLNFFKFFYEIYA